MALTLLYVLQLWLSFPLKTMIGLWHVLEIVASSLWQLCLAALLAVGLVVGPLLSLLILGLCGFAIVFLFSILDLAVRFSNTGHRNIGPISSRIQKVSDIAHYLRCTFLTIVAH